MDETIKGMARRIRTWAPWVIGYVVFVAEPFLFFTCLAAAGMYGAFRVVVDRE